MFTELNDPIDQEARFKDQLAAKEADMMKRMNGCRFY